MGLDVNTHLVLGSVVQDAEILDYSERVPYKCNDCPNFHAAGLVFCGICGHRFAPIKETSWTSGVASFLKDRDSDMTPWGREDPFFNVRAVQSSEDREKMPIWVVGIKFAGQSLNNGGRGGTIEWGRLERARIEVQVLCHRMGLSPREVSLFPVMYVSC